MTDTDLIACVYPHCDGDIQHAINAIQLGKNNPRHVPGLVKLESQSDRRDRGSTEEPEPHGGSRLDCLELRFSNGPKTREGFLFGRNKDCDIVLPNYSGVSSCHFALTFDEHNRPIVKDRSSLIGTQVQYKGDGNGWRSRFNWIVGGHKVPQEKTPIVVHVNEYLKFQLVVPIHDVNSQLYKDNIARFRQGTAGFESLFSELEFREDTKRATGTHTPGTGPIFLRKKLGEGSFGVVTHLWNVSDGKEYALKQPSVRAIREKEVDADLWKREGDILKRISHKNIIKRKWQMEELLPGLCLEYVPGGSLRDHEHISTGECKQVLHQLLSALAYLHELQPPIVHRDIKPDNILVQYRSAGYIHVKFGDFGLSRERRENDHWKTMCGTWKYAAPEILDIKKYYNSGGRERQHYTAVVDVWSLGVVVFKLLHELPPYDMEYEHQGTLWASKILETLEEVLREKPDEVLDFLSEIMLVIKPEMRGSAQECYNRTLRLFGGSVAMPSNPMPTSYIEGQEAILGSNDPHTAILRDTEAPPDPRCTESNPIDTAEIERYITGLDDVGPSINSAEIQRYIRSIIPAPTSQRQRSERVSKPSTATHSRRARHSELAESLAQGKENEVYSEIEHCYHDPANSICLGSSLSALEQELPSSWNQSSELSPPQTGLVSEHNRVVGVIDNAQDRYPVNSDPGQSVGQPWSNLGPSCEAKGLSRTGGGSHEGEGQDAQCTYDDDQALAATLLLEIHRGGHALAN